MRWTGRCQRRRRWHGLSLTAGKDEGLGVPCTTNSYGQSQLGSNYRHAIMSGSSGAAVGSFNYQGSCRHDKHASQQVSETLSVCVRVCVCVCRDHQLKFALLHYHARHWDDAWIELGLLIERLRQQGISSVSDSSGDVDTSHADTASIDLLSAELLLEKIRLQLSVTVNP